MSVRVVVSVLLVCGLFVFVGGFVGGDVGQVTTLLGGSVSYTLSARSGGVSCTFDYVGVGEHQAFPGPGSVSWLQVLPSGVQVFSEDITGSVHSDSPVDLYLLNSAQLNVWVAARQPCNLTEGFVAFQPAVVDYSYSMSTLPQVIPNFKNLDMSTTGIYLLIINKSVSLVAHVSVSYQLSVVYGVGSSSATTTITSESLSSVLSTVSSVSLVPFPTSVVTGIITGQVSLTQRASTSLLTSGALVSGSVSGQGSSGSVSFMDLLLSGKLNALGAVATVISIMIGWLLTTRKRRLLSGYLTKIDSTYNSYAVNREECKGRLNQMKDDVADMLKTGKIDATHFAVLESKISQYLRDLKVREQSTPPD